YRDLLARLDGPTRPDEDSLPADERLGVGAARVVYVAREVGTRAAVNGVVVVQLEEVPAAPPLDLLARDHRPRVLDDPPARRNRAQGEQAEPRRRAFDGVKSLLLNHAEKSNSPVAEFRFRPRHSPPSS